VVAGLASTLAGPSVAAGLIGGSALAAAAGAVIVRLRRRLDGDGFGALIELTFAGVLVAVLAARSVFG
jgi:cobalamin synthase